VLFRSDKVGIRAVGKTAYELANGVVEEYEFGLAEISFMAASFLVLTTRNQFSG